MVQLQLTGEPGVKKEAACQCEKRHSCDCFTYFYYRGFNQYFCNFQFWFTLTAFLLRFLAEAQSYKKTQKHCTLPAWTDRVSNFCINKFVEHLANREIDNFLRILQRPKTEIKESEY